MTTAQARREIDRLSRLGRIQLVKLNSVSDKRIRKMYQRASGRIANLIQLEGAPVTRLQSIQRDLNRQIASLSKKISRTTTRTLSEATKISIRTVENTAAVWTGILTGNATAKAGASTFDRIYNGAMRSLLTSPVDGIKLSDRIWDIHQTSLRRMKRVIADGYLSGLSDANIRRQLKSMLILPNVDMRTTFWKEFFKQYPPGRGVYKSAHKNVMRIIRTEVNEAYRRATVGYAKERAWVAGVKWNLVAGHPEIDICDDLSSADDYGLGSGVYTPDATPVTPHPHCLCYLTMEPRQELMPDVKQEASGIQREAETGSVPIINLTSFKTTKEAEVWFKENLGVDKVSLSGFDLPLLEQYARGAEAMLKEFPELRGTIKTIKSTTAKTRYASYTQQVKLGELQKGNINISKYYGHSLEEMQKMIDVDIVAEFHFEGMTSAHIMAHELTHTLDSHLTAKMIGVDLNTILSSAERRLYIDTWNYSSMAQKIKKTAYEKLGLQIRPTTAEEAKKAWRTVREIGVYAEKNSKELMAQGIADALLSENPKPISKAILESVREFRQ